MKYLNAKNILPEWLLEELQDYIQGEAIYVPRKDNDRAGWGAANGAKEKYGERNLEIARLYMNGVCIDDLSLIYNLTDHSIKKILSGMREQSYKSNSEKEAEPWKT